MANPDSVLPDDPSWLKTAFKELGEREIAGRKSNPDIQRFLQSTIVGPVVPVADEVPWCSAFVNFCMEQNGLKGTNNRLARSWLTWGKATKQPTRGCVVVFDRPGGGPQAGHVAFYLSGSPQTGIRVLGGNQSDAVTISNQHLPFLAFRVPEQEDDMTEEQARQLKAVFDGLTVPGTTSPEQTVNLMFQRIKNIEAAINVPGTTSAEEAFNKLFERVRNIENLVEEISKWV